MRNLSGPRPSRGFSLVLALVTIGICFLLLAGVLLWSSHSGQMSLRQTEYSVSLAAAEAATEKVVAQISRDFRIGGHDTVDANVGAYQALVPSSLESPAWDGYDFLDSGGILGRVEMGQLSGWQFGPLSWGHGTLSGYSATYGVLATARNRVSGNNVRAAVRQEVQVAELPLSAFFMFGELDLELNPGSGTWVINGPVHGNGHIYSAPSVAVTFQNFVTAAGEIFHQRAPGDPNAPGGGTLTFAGGKESSTSFLNPPFQGVPSDPAQLWAYCSNRADLRIVVVDDFTVRAYTRTGEITDTNVVYTLVPSTQVTFRDWRQNSLGELMRTAVLDVNVLRTDPRLPPYFGGQPPRCVYLTDARVDSWDVHAVLVKQADVLPTGGLTIATDRPLYLLGNFNATLPPAPAGLLADAVTVFSPNWDLARPGLNTLPVSLRVAADTTVNAAIVTGIVPTHAGFYSGGAENSIRLLEDWTGQNLFFNGSLALLFASRIATENWVPPGVAGDVYLAPRRVFQYATNVVGPPTLPNEIKVRTLLRGNWRVVAPGSTL
jgi:hypothetical protein